MYRRGVLLKPLEVAHQALARGGAHGEPGRTRPAILKSARGAWSTLGKAGAADAYLERAREATRTRSRGRRCGREDARSVANRSHQHRARVGVPSARQIQDDEARTESATISEAACFTRAALPETLGADCVGDRVLSPRRWTPAPHEVARDLDALTARVEPTAHVPLYRDTPGGVSRASPRHSARREAEIRNASWHLRAQCPSVVVVMTAARALLASANARAFARPARLARLAFHARRRRRACAATPPRATLVPRPARRSRPLFAASVVALHGANPVALADAETASEPASVSSASTVSIASFVDVDAAPAPSVTSSTPSSRRSSSSDRLPSDPDVGALEPGEVILDYGRVFAPNARTRAPRHHRRPRGAHRVARAW